MIAGRMMPWTTFLQEISLEYIHLFLYLMLFTQIRREEPLRTNVLPIIFRFPKASREQVLHGVKRLEQWFLN